MSESCNTPRTDADIMRQAAEYLDGKIPVEESGRISTVAVSFARGIERELSVMTQERDELRRENEQLRLKIRMLADWVKRDCPLYYTGEVHDESKCTAAIEAWAEQQAAMDGKEGVK